MIKSVKFLGYPDTDEAARPFNVVMVSGQVGETGFCLYRILTGSTRLVGSLRTLPADSLVDEGQLFEVEKIS